MQQVQHLDRLLTACRDVRTAQTEVLARILGSHKGCDWLRRQGVTDADIASLTDTADTLDWFRQQLPLQHYADIAADVERMLSGESGVLTQERVVAFFQTSGSTSVPKLIPVTASLMREKVAVFASFWEQVYRDYPRVRDGVVVSNFIDAGETRKSTGGAEITSESGFWNRRGRSLASMARWPLPAALRRISERDARLYAIARILLQGELHCLMSLNPSTLLQFCHTLAQHGEALLAGLQDGTWGCRNEAWQTALNSGAGLESSQVLVANADAAARLRQALSADPECPRLDALWPELQLVICWQSALVQPYIERLRPWLGEVPMRDYITQSSECMMAIPLEDGSNGGVLAINSHFFEFIPEHRQTEAQPPTVLADELEEGKRYELVVTTGGGLYRYRMGDAMRVSGFVQGAPRLTFESRFGRTASISGEKLTETQVLAAAADAEVQLGLRPSEFLFCPMSAQLPGYALVVEGLDDAAEVLAWTAAMHAHLGHHNGEYQDKCASGRLAPPTAFRALPGSLSQLRQQRRAAGVSEAQVKDEVLVGEVDYHNRIKGLAAIRMSQRQI